MLRGRFGNTSGQPYIPARVYIPRLGLLGNISFLLDTGAESTVLMPADAQTLGVDYDVLGNPAASVGIGGTVDVFQEPARLAFAENGGFMYGYEVNLLIYPGPDSESMTFPSLLGRNVIDRWRVIYDRSTSELAARVVSFDQRWTLASPLAS